PQDIINEGIEEWGEVVVGFFVDRRLPFKVVKESLTKIWKVKGAFSITTDKELYYFNFHDEEDRKSVIEQGPVFIAGRLFVVRRWTEEVERLRDRVNTMPVWANFVIGFPLFSEAMTFKKERLEYARFESTIQLKMGEEYALIKVDYPWKPPACTICQCFGHKTTKCAKAPAKVWVERNTHRTEKGVYNDSGVGPSGTKEDGLGMELAMVPIVVEVVPIAIDYNRSKEKELVTPNRFSALQIEKEQFLEAQDESEDEIEVLEDNKEPEYFKDHLPLKCLVMEVKKAAREKVIVQNTASKTEKPKCELVVKKPGEKITSAPTVRKTRGRSKGNGKEDPPPKPLFR
ncbi:hypothetical protein AQUCO_02100147v1, partial [Aquilegia coerulea]